MEFSKSLIPALLVLEIIRIPEFLDADRTFANEDLQEWYETLVIPYKKDIRTCLGISIGEKDTPITELPPYIYTIIAENPYPSMDATP